MRAIVAQPGVIYPLYGMASIRARVSDFKYEKEEQAFSLTVSRSSGEVVLRHVISGRSSWAWDAGSHCRIYGALELQVLGDDPVFVEVQEVCQGCRGFESTWEHTEECLIPLAVACAEASR